METCKTCKYFQVFLCRRYPPVGLFTNEGWSTFARVLPSDWCGEWKSKTPPNLIYESKRNK